MGAVHEIWYELEHNSVFFFLSNNQPDKISGNFLPRKKVVSGEHIFQTLSGDEPPRYKMFSSVHSNRKTE